MIAAIKAFFTTHALRVAAWCMAALSFLAFCWPLVALVGMPSGWMRWKRNPKT